MTKLRSEAAAAARVAARLGSRKRTELLTSMRPAFTRTEAWLHAGKYTAGGAGFRVARCVLMANSRARMVPDSQFWGGVCCGDYAAPTLPDDFELAIGS